MKASVKIARIEQDCVACGTCVPVCPRAALRIENGVCAVVNAVKCIGCGKCVHNCPAAVITLIERG